MKTGFVHLTDGRQLEYIDNGLASTRALVLHHGSPIEMHIWDSTMQWLTERGVRAIAYTRPGYGESTRNPERTVIGNNSDLEAVLTHLGVTEFVSVGWSAGGPPALASGLLSGCRGVAAIASPAPFDGEGLDYFAGMPEDFARESAISSQSVDAAFEFKQATVDGLRSLTVEGFVEGFRERPAYAEFEQRYQASFQELVDSLQRGLTPDALAYAEDDHSFLKPWGFDLTSLTVPVGVWLGDHDEFIPPGHATWLAEHIPNADLHLLTDQNHISIVVEYRDEILNTAIAALD